ncbi:hypothetical protein [Natrinema sp. 1APR25-10V2]|uniref:hypothetical protein n=1 Tax=Natrinema sp. 1APR25-10V2 TaxID=2951081 RepID=UPI002875035C|nr:hypothetical protein [Natrinema sp. 1APR25-10V2]MDS0473515.1 hypothetical protein [Natrinema sp. 1APR25-10V2]
MSAAATGSRIMEFANEHGHTFTRYERIYGGYTGRLLIDGDESFYERNPKDIAEEMPAWPNDGDEEGATNLLMQNGWEFTYHDAENAHRRRHDMFRG